jgi:hypothetical protein
MSIPDIEELDVSKPSQPQILSISRRTDVPACYLREFLKYLDDGKMNVENPYNKKKYSVSFDKVVCCVWWSKDFKKWIRAYKKDSSIFNKYPLHQFQFTLNSRSPLEFVKTSFEKRIKQTEWLVETFRNDNVMWRFDPIVHWKNINKDETISETQDNLNDFEYLCSRLSEYGINQCIFAFCRPYQKTKQRMNRSGRLLITLKQEEKIEVIENLMTIAIKYNIQLCGCNEPDFDTHILEEEQAIIINKGCIDSGVIEKELQKKGTNVKLSKAKDTGQRKTCLCHQSRDIGSYNHVCQHGCIYCYATPCELK